MRREKFTTLLFCIIVVIKLQAQEMTFTPNREYIVKPLNQANMLKQCSRSTPSSLEGYWLVDSNAVQSLHNNFKKIQKLKPDCCIGIGWRIADLNYYAFQYLGIILDGNKYIYVNAFPNQNFREGKEIPLDRLIDVCDGGTGFWGVLFDVGAGTFSHLSVNGEV
ncbi:MAG TPA: hypothetical protein VNS32_27205 [Flavisolibacter sp.]|nr:hypothetical protein [Flavisolibacter sp.]